MIQTRRRDIRLFRGQYVGRKFYFVTICCENRRCIFQDASHCEVVIGILKRVSTSMQFFVHAYCLMPDHVHLLVEGQRDTSDLVRFIAQWKQVTGYLFRNELPRRFWQRRFYDYILRRPQDCDPVAWYIWMNPVRKGLVASARQYPFSGSFTVEWPRISPPGNTWVPPWKLDTGTR